MPLDINNFSITSTFLQYLSIGGIVTDGLVYYMDVSLKHSYPMGGTIIYDLSGNENNGTLTNGPTYSSLNKGIIEFDGVNDYIDLGTFFNYNYFTISLWVNPGSSQTTYADIFDNNHTGTQNFVCQQNVSNTNQYEFTVIGASDFSATGLFTLSSNTWAHLTFTFDGSVARSYINGSLFGTGGSCTPNYVSPYLRLGCWAGAGTLSRFWNGKYGNFIVYNRNLSATEILQNYNATKNRFNK